MAGCFCFGVRYGVSRVGRMAVYAMTLFDPAPSEPAPEPDILDWLAAAASPLTGVSTLAAGDAQERLRSARRSIEYLRDANARLIAENATLRDDAAHDLKSITELRAELLAARGEEGR